MARILTIYEQCIMRTNDLIRRIETSIYSRRTAIVRKNINMNYKNLKNTMGHRRTQNSLQRKMKVVKEKENEERGKLKRVLKQRKSKTYCQESSPRGCPKTG